MNSADFGSLTSPTGGMSRPRLGMPRMKSMSKRGMGVPSLGGLSLMKFATGGPVPSMGDITMQDTLLSMPQRILPDYLMSRMAEGGIAGPMDPLDYPERALRRQDTELRLARGELEDRPIRQTMPPYLKRPPGWEPHHTFTQRGRIDQAFNDLMADRERENPEEEYSFDPSDVTMSLSGAKGLAGLVAPGPMMGGLSALLRSGEAFAPPMKPEQRNKIDWRAIEEVGRRNPYPRDIKALLGRLFR